MRSSTNQIGTYLTVASFTMLLALMAFMIPTTFISDALLLSWGIFIGDTLQYLTLFIIWLIAVRIFLASHQAVQSLAKIGLALYTGVCVAASYWVNIPYNTRVIRTADGGYMLDFAYPQYYAILTAIDFLALILLGMYFFTQAKVATKTSQRWRLRSFAWFFLIMGMVFALQPFLPLDFQSATFSFLQVVGFLSVVVCTVLAMRAARREASTSK